jgi:L-fuculose-phosphate aldolase
LLANHGMVALGATLPEALKLAAEIETLAAQYWHACQIGTPHVLDAAELARVRSRFAEYGQRRRRP